MMTYKDLNLSGRPLDIAKDGDVFEGGNFSQDEPETIITDAKDLTFRGCNLTRVRIDPTWKTPDCNTCPHPKEPEIIVDPVDAEISATVAKMDELATAYPEKFSKELKAAVSLEKTQGLLSADGKPIEIAAPEGWKE